MKYILSKKLRHAECLSRLIPKGTEPFEDTMIAALPAENLIKGIV